MTTPEIEIADLESQIDAVISSHQRLTLENNSLQKKVASLVEELSEMTSKKDKATELLRKVINQLKDELVCQPK